MARLFVITARDEPIAIILRRGPSDWYHVIEARLVLPAEPLDETAES